MPADLRASDFLVASIEVPWYPMARAGASLVVVRRSLDIAIVEATLFRIAEDQHDGLSHFARIMKEVGLGSNREER